MKERRRKIFWLHFERLNSLEGKRESSDVNFHCWQYYVAIIITIMLFTHGGRLYIHAGKISCENNERVSFVVTSSTASKHTTWLRTRSLRTSIRTAHILLILSVFSSRDY